MNRTLEDIRSNLPFVGCDNQTAIEMCDEIERLRAIVDRLPKDEDAALVAASNMLCEYAEKHLPYGWALHHVTTSEEAYMSLIDPGGNDLDYDSEFCAFRSACNAAREEDARASDQ